MNTYNILLLAALVCMGGCEKKTSNSVDKHIKVSASQYVNNDCINKEFVNNLKFIEPEDSAGLYLIQIINIDLDSLFVPEKTVIDVPILYANEIECFSNLKDSMPYIHSLPFTPPSRLTIIRKGEKKCFISLLPVHNNSYTKAKYTLFLSNDRKKALPISVFLTKTKDALIQIK